MLLLKKSDFTAVGGFDEGYRRHLGDVDLCLRLTALGRRHIYTPFAVMEFLSPAEDAPAGATADYERLRHQWPDVGHDPYCQPSWRDETEA